MQNHLKTYHEGLQQALEVSSFYQQADNTLSTINNMVPSPYMVNPLLPRVGVAHMDRVSVVSQRKNPSVSNELLHAGDREMRDIASQIMVGSHA